MFGLQPPPSTTHLPLASVITPATAGIGMSTNGGGDWACQRALPCPPGNMQCAVISGGALTSRPLALLSTTVIVEDAIVPK